MKNKIDDVALRLPTVAEMDDEVVEQLTESELCALRAVGRGADIRGLKLAETLRSLERSHPELLRITSVMGNYGVREPLPYFGAVLTTDGSRVVRDATCRAPKRRKKSGVPSRRLRRRRVWVPSVCHA
jgi:hypothetical protein